LAANDIVRARQMSEHILRKNPDYLPALILKAEILMAHNETDESLQLLNKLIEKHSNTPRLYYLKGIALLKKDDAAKAKIEFGKISKDSPEYLDAKLTLAQIFFKENNLAQAEEALGEILQSGPDNYQAQKLMGNVMAQKGDFEKSKIFYQSLIDAAPNNPEGLILMGLMNQRQHRFDLAVKNFEKAMAIPPQRVDVFSYLIASLISNRQIDAAVARCDDMLEKTNNNPSAQSLIYHLKGKAYLAGKNIKEAEKSFKTSISVNPDFLSPYYSLAGLYFRSGRTDAAVAQYESAVGKDIQQEVPHMMLGIIFSMKQQWDLAEFHYRKAIDMKPGFIPAINNLAYLLADKNKNLDEALRLAQKAREQMPDDPRIKDTLGWVYVKLGFYDQAIRILSESIQDIPENPTVHYHLGIAYYKKGANSQALSALKQAIELDADFPGSDQAKEIMSRI
jgi:tetratricopeptide (TPR) repeat protein